MFFTIILYNEESQGDNIQLNMLVSLSPLCSLPHSASKTQQSVYNSKMSTTDKVMNIKTRKERKAETRKTLLNAATELFSNEGYDTTLAAIADHAGVHAQTLISHFPTKADILTGIWQESLRMFEKEFLARDTDALGAYRAYIEASFNRLPADGRVMPMVHSLPAITGDAQQALYRVRELIAEGIAEDLNVDSTQDLRPTLIACMVFSGVQHVAQGCSGKRFNKKKYIASLLAVIDTAQEMLGQDLVTVASTKDGVLAHARQ